MDAAQYADLFLAESREHLSAINLALLDIERALTAQGSLASRASADGVVRDAVASLFRAVHTIKGMSATMRYDAVAALSHEMEALLDRLRRGELVPNAPLMDVLFASADVLEASIERAVSNRPADPRLDDVVTQLQGMAGLADDTTVPPRGAARSTRKRKASRRIRRAASDEAPMTSVTHSTVRTPNGSAQHSGDPAGNGPEVTIRIHLVPTAPLRGARAAVAVQRVASLGQVLAVTPPVETFADDGPGPELVEIRLRSSAPAATIVEQVRATGDVADVEVLAEPLPGDRRPGRRSVAIGVPTDGDGTGASVPRPRHVRIDLRRLDALMNLIGELVIARGRLTELTGGLGESALTEAVTDTSRLIGDLQEEIMSCRMVPVWQVFDRFPRFVRDTAHSLGKQVQFEVEGKEIELDKSMLDEIGDPIVHLLRNALDHGIEAPAARLACGKPAEGRLRLSAARDRSAVLIRVSDDGRGIDRVKVLARALESGLVDPGTTTLSDDEVIRLIARPGFTTADQVTDVSGRGVGIDAVQARVRALGGSIDIRSAPGQGTTVTARLPLTLAIMRALLARVGGESYAFPLAHIDETIASAGASYAAVRGRPVLLVRGDAIPFLDLRDVVGLPPVRERSRDEESEQHIIVVESGGHRAAVGVEELVGQADIVVKQYDAVQGGAALFSGATILGDGAPALIVDVGSLV
jgi:two-component system, chemotaxis family, sensor kinase CheA